MDMKTRALAAGLLFSTTMPVVHAQTPPATFESWGVCPFECCTYREWTVDSDIPVHQDRNDQSPVVFHLRRGESVKGITGVVITEHPAAIRINRELRDGFIEGNREPQLSFKRGDVVYMLTPLGEGSYRFWYKGKVYQSGIDLAAMPGVEGKTMKLTWWKQVRNKAGKVGWTKSEKFGNIDACG
jgi:hypothetical protein